MPSKKSKSGQSGNIRKFRSDVAKLKSLGLVSPRVDARSQRPTKYMRGTVKKLSDVLTGKAKAVQVPKARREKYEASGFTTKRGRVVVPVENKTERVRYDKKTGTIRTQRKAFGRNVSKIISPKGEALPQARKGKRIAYTIPFGKKGRYTFDSQEELERFMNGYDRYKNWQDYVEIEELDAIEVDDDNDIEADEE